MVRQPRTSPPGRRGMVVVAALGVLAAGCTSTASSEPKISDFTAGTCRSAAPAVLGIGTAVGEVQRKHHKPATVSPALGRAQAALRALPSAPDPNVRGRLSALVVAVGFFRIGVDSSTFQPQRTTEVAAAQRAVLAVCTSRGKS